MADAGLAGKRLALQALGGDHVAFGHLTTTITVADSDRAKVEEKVRAVERIVETKHPEGVDPDVLAPGESTTVTGEGYTPNSTATVQLIDPEGNPVGDPIVVETADSWFVYRVLGNPATGDLTQLHTVEDRDPSFLALDPIVIAGAISSAHFTLPLP